MNIQDRIVKIITIMQNEGQGLTRSQLQETLTTAAEPDVDWNAIFDRAMEVGLLKVKNQRQGTLTYTPDGKKFRKKPYPVSLGGESPAGSYTSSGSDTVDEDLLMVMRAAQENRAEDAAHHVTSARSKLQLKLIRAIDRKIALDDFAESENIDLDEILDNLEDMRRHGKRMDISYFVNEVIGQDNVDEVRDSLENGVFDMEAIRQEWSDVYNDEELRLLGYVLS